jgi:RimJ/RimL family protein N-acetyltransferase
MRLSGPIALPIAHCALRAWRDADLRSLQRHADNRNVSRALFDRFPFPYTERDAERWIAIATAAEPDQDVHLAITVHDEAVGGMSAMRGRENARFTAEVGYWLGEEHWGRGIGTAALAAFAAELFRHTDLERLEAGVFTSNHASMRVLEKAGFTCEGVRRRMFFKHGVFEDDAMYALLRGDRRGQVPQ